MKRVLLLLVSLLLISSAAMADYIGIWSDASGASCALGPPGVFSPTATIIHKFTKGATGSRFKATFPAGTSFFGFNTPYVPDGVLTSDLSVRYGQCLTGSIVVGTINAIYAAGTAWLVPADTFAHVMYTDCIFDAWSAEGGPAYIGGTGPCLPDNIAVEPSTWGGVKALYR